MFHLLVDSDLCFLTNFVFKSALASMSIAIAIWFWFPFTWDVIFPSFHFQLVWVFASDMFFFNQFFNPIQSICIF
jgi:hypothetical protein